VGQAFLLLLFSILCLWSRRPKNPLGGFSAFACRLRTDRQQAGKKKGGWGEGIFARPRLPPPPNFVPTELARR